MRRDGRWKFRNVFRSRTTCMGFLRGSWRPRLAGRGGFDLPRRPAPIDATGCATCSRKPEHQLRTRPWRGRGMQGMEEHREGGIVGERDGRVHVRDSGDILREKLTCLPGRRCHLGFEPWLGQKAARPPFRRNWGTWARCDGRGARLGCD